MGRTSTRNTRLTKKRKAEFHEAEVPSKKKLPVENDVDIVQDDDIMYLNVGGETMACNRSTLCQVKDSFLASMFSGRWENQQKKDNDGNIFLNFNPDYFKLILNFLRSKEISIPEYPPPVPVPAKEDFPHFYNLINFLGLQEEFKVKKADIFWDTCASNISITGEERIVKFGYHDLENSDVNDTKTYVQGESCNTSGRTQWRLEIISWDQPGSIFFGVLEEDSDNVNNEKPIWEDKGANGWIGRCICQNGKDSYMKEPIICVGVVHVLTLDLDAMTLSLANGRDMVDMKIQRVKDIEDECHCWSLCIGFQSRSQSEVRLLD